MNDKIISQTRYESIKQLFIANEIDMSDREIGIYANVFEIISYFVNGKLTDEEMFMAYDFLSDLIVDKLPKYAVHVPKEDRIRAQVRFLEELPYTAGKLTDEEKIGFAYCVWTAVCLRVLDEENDCTCNGIVLFDSIEHIENNYKHDLEERPDFFSIEKQELVIDDEYGQKIEKAINTTSVSMSYAYLDHLRYQGKPIKYKRMGSCVNSAGKMVDKYLIYTEKKTLFSKKQVDITYLYINGYCNSTPKVAPKGFTLE